MQDAWRVYISLIRFLTDSPLSSSVLFKWRILR